LFNKIKGAIFRTLDKFFPRPVTDWYVMHVMNMPLQLGGGAKALFTDYHELKKQCTDFDDQKGIERYLKSRRDAAEAHLSAVGPRDQIFLSALAIPLGQMEALNIVDFGGSSGEKYYLLKKTAGLNKIGSYYIVEQQKIVDAFKNEALVEPKLKYISAVTQVPGHEKIHYLYISGALQYMENPVEFLKNMVRSLKPVYVLINRTPFWNKPDRLIKQLDYKIPGSNYRSSYTAWIIDQGQTEKAMGDLGYDVIPFAFNMDAPYIMGHGLLPYKSLFFKLRAGL